MRVARFVLRGSRLLLLVTLLARPGAASAGGEAASPDPATASADTLFTIYPVSGPWIKARYVEHWSMDMIRYRTEGGATGYLASNKVRSIEDTDGNERQREVLDARRHLGTPAPREAGSMGSWLTREIFVSPDRDRRDYFFAGFGYTTEIGGAATVGAPRGVAQSEFGWMKNLSRDWALGGVLQLGSDADAYHALGAGARVRRYLDRVWSIEGTVGAFTADYGSHRRVQGAPLFAELGVTAFGSVTLCVRAEDQRYTYQRYISPFPVIVLGDAEVSGRALRFGLRVGPRPRAVSIPAAILGSLLNLSPGSRASY
jgi:hypothetical protein